MIRAKYLGLNLLGKSPCLSGSLCPAVDVVDLSPSCNCRVQMEIWLGDKNSHDWFCLLLLTIWIARGLNRMGTPGQRFWKWPHDARLFGAEWTHDVISRGSETDHYTNLCQHTYSLLSVRKICPLLRSSNFSSRNIANFLDAHMKFPLERGLKRNNTTYIIESDHNTVSIHDK